LNKDSTASQGAFQQFLRWLDEGVDSSGERYLELRRRLVLYFNRKNCLAADDLADETLSRVAQKLQEKGEITNLSPAHYCYVTARFVFLEYIRRAEHGNKSLEELETSGAGGEPAAQPHSHFESAAQERTFDCLERCLKRLSRDDNELILEYYRGEQQEKIKRRQQMAARLGVSANALSIRACRIRNRLESCVRSCCAWD
jgi:RNA polymerase sigma factor (sigma-70 family)